LLAKRYPEVNHCDIKKYVYNSIHLVLSWSGTKTHKDTDNFLVTMNWT
jgi:hypothetical protein